MSKTTNIVKRIERARRDDLLVELRGLRAQHTALGATKKRLVRNAFRNRSIRSSRDIAAITAARGTLSLVMAGVMAQLDAACDASLWLSEFI